LIIERDKEGEERGEEVRKTGEKRRDSPNPFHTLVVPLLEHLQETNKQTGGGEHDHCS